MLPQQTDLKKGLFHLRLGGGFYDETGKDCFPDFLDSLRPHLKTDERVKVALLKSPALAEMYVDGRLILEVLLNELPDPQIRFILNYFSFQLLGEDGMSTENAHRIMARRFPNDPWFRRQVIQFARGRYLGLGFSGAYYHSDLSESDGRLLLQWAGTDARFLPRCLNGFSLDEVLLLLARHPDFPLEEYDLAGGLAAVPKLFAEASGLSTEAERLGFFASCPEVNDQGQRRLMDILAEDLQPENALILHAIADRASQPATTWARVLLLRNSDKSPLARDWAQNHLAAHTEDQWWLSVLAFEAPDPRWSLDAVRKLLAQPDRGFRKHGVPRGLLRLCESPQCLPGEDVVPVLRQALADNSLEYQPALRLALARGYPHHPDTQAILQSSGDLDALRKLKGLTPGLVKMAVDEARQGNVGTGAIAILRDAQEDSAFRALIKLAEESPDDATKAGVLDALAEGYAHRAEVKPLLIKRAELDEKRESVWRKALLALAWNYAVDPDTRATLERLAGSRQRQSCRSRELLDYITDPDYSVWLANRNQRWADLVARLHESNDDSSKYRVATYELALWFGEDEKTVDLLLGFASAGEQSPNSSNAGQPSWQMERVAKARTTGAAESLRFAVMRWPDNPHVHQAVIAALQSPVTAVRDEAACLLSRAYSQDPQTVTLLRPLIGISPFIFGEYLGVRLGEPDAMAEGVAVLEQLAECKSNEPLALDGPLLLLRHFGPRKDLFRVLSHLGAATGNSALQKGISRALDTFFPGRKLKSLDAEIATDRIEGLQSTDVPGADLLRVKAMCQSDPNDSVRLAAAQALFERGPKDAWPFEAVRDLIRRGIYQAIPLLGRMSVGDETSLGWLLDSIAENSVSPDDAGPRRILTNTVAECYLQTAQGRQYLVQRTRDARDMAEFSAAVRALCTLYHQEAQVRSLLDDHLLDPRLDGPTADHLMETQTADWPAHRKIDFFSSVAQDPNAPETSEAQRVAPMRLGLLIACECHGEVPPEDPEARRVVAALIDIMEKHRRQTVRLHAHTALLMAVSGCGKNLEAGLKQFPEADEALTRWGAREYNKA